MTSCRKTLVLACTVLLCLCLAMSVAASSFDLATARERYRRGELFTHAQMRLLKRTEQRLARRAADSGSDMQSIPASRANSAVEDDEYQKRYNIIFSASSEAAEARARLAELLQDSGYSTSFVDAEWHGIGVSGEFDPALLDQLTNDFPSVLVELDGIVEMHMPYNGPVNTTSWGLERITNGNSGYDNITDFGGRDGSGVVIYVVDSGLFNSSQFEDRVIGNLSDWNFEPNDRAAGVHFDCAGHGTHVAGIAASKNYGVATNAWVIPMKVFSCGRTTSTSTIVSALATIVSYHPKKIPAIVNLSLGSGASLVAPGTRTKTAFGVVIGRLLERNITVVVSAGNSDNNTCATSPAQETGVIAVGSTNKTDDKSFFSNWGPCMTLYAPGHFILSPSALLNATEGIVYGMFRVLSGTSMASPHVAGVAALILQQNPTFTPAQVRDEILKFALKDVVNNGSYSQSPNFLLQVPKYNTPAPAPVAFAADNSVTLTAPSAVTVAFNSTSLALSYTWTADLNASIQCTMRRFFNTTANELVVDTRECGASSDRCTVDIASGRYKCSILSNLLNIDLGVSARSEVGGSVAVGPETWYISNSTGVYPRLTAPVITASPPPSSRPSPSVSGSTSRSPSLTPESSPSASVTPSSSVSPRPSPLTITGESPTRKNEGHRIATAYTSVATAFAVAFLVYG